MTTEKIQRKANDLTLQASICRMHAKVKQEHEAAGLTVTTEQTPKPRAPEPELTPAELEAWRLRAREALDTPMVITKREGVG